MALCCPMLLEGREGFMAGTHTHIFLGPMVWVMVAACVLGMILMIVALLALSRDRKRSLVRGAAYFRLSFHGATPHSVIEKQPAKLFRSKVTIFPGNVSRVRLKTIQAEVRTDREVM